MHRSGAHVSAMLLVMHGYGLSKPFACGERGGALDHPYQYHIYAEVRKVDCRTVVTLYGSAISHDKADTRNFHRSASEQDGLICLNKPDVRAMTCSKCHWEANKRTLRL